MMDEEAREFARYLKRKLVNSLKRKKWNVTDALLKSIETSIERSSASELPKILLEYNLYGNFIEIRKMFWTEQPPVDAIEAWVEALGPDKFKFTPGYKNGTGPAFNKSSRIAWAIARRKKQDFKVKNKRTWKQKELGTAVAFLTHNMSEKFAEYVTGKTAGAIERGPEVTIGFNANTYRGTNRLA